MKKQIDFNGSVIVLNSECVTTNGTLARYHCYFAYMGSISEFEYMLNAGEEDDVITAFANFVDSVIATMDGNYTNVGSFKNAAAFASVFGTERNEQYAHMLKSLLKDMTQSEEIDNVTKFVSVHRKMPVECFAYKCMVRLNNGGKLTENEEGMLMNICTNGIYIENGYRFDFRPFMSRFWVQNREDGRMFEEYVFQKYQLDLDEDDFEIVQVPKPYYY